jgi:peptide/nickel transport system ATP-binding protein
MSAVLEIEGLTIWYPGGFLRQGRMAVKGAGFSIARGRTMALVGGSGSGKTSLARALLGLVPFQAGILRINGWQPKSPKDRVWHVIRRETGMMFQDPAASLDPRMSIWASVAEPLAIHGGPGALFRRARWEEAAAMLDMVGLPRAFLGRRPSEISGGQARRVAIARALVLRPKLVIADEPTAGLDVSVQGDVLNLLADLQAELGLAYLVITHDLAVARHIADDIAVMHEGHIVEQGPADDILRAPRHGYTQSLLAHVVA